MPMRRAEAPHKVPWRSCPPQPGSQLAQMQPTAPSGNEAAPRPDAAPRDVTASPEIARPRSGQDATASASEDVGMSTHGSDSGRCPGAARGCRRGASGEWQCRRANWIMHAWSVFQSAPRRSSSAIPIIADVTVQRRNGILVVTGKSYGTTNLIALDSTGAWLAELDDQSSKPRTEAVVTVQRGSSRANPIPVTPTCQPSLRLGDSPGHFDGVGSQATQPQRTRNAPLRRPAAQSRREHSLPVIAHGGA